MKFSPGKISVSFLTLVITTTIVSACVGIFVYTLASKDTEPDKGSFMTDIRQHSFDQKNLTNPLLECREFPEHLMIGDRIALENEINDIISQYKGEGSVSDVSVYFRELIGGPWFGIDEEKKFTPASLLKLPLAISFYWRAEQEPGILTQEIEYVKSDANFEANQPYGPSSTLESEHVYSVDALIELMLRESSNEAALVLSQIAGEEQTAKVYKDFGFERPTVGKDYEIDVHTYGSFFRILFNATYIDRNASERILSILSESSFKEGIVAGVPQDVVVAHKFGTRDLEGQIGKKQLHDCGIVYAESPYILCIMTQGNNFPQLAKLIKDVSSLVYREISQK